MISGQFHIKKCWFILASLFLFSCENNIEVIKNLGKSEDLPAVTMKNIDITYSDSAKIKLKVSAPKVIRFTQLDRALTEFPEGILVSQFDSAMNVIATIKANSAVYYDKTKIWVARGNVIAKNTVKNEQLNTEELFWNQARGTIYSTKASTIVNEDGVFYGEGGFEAKEDMSQWKMIGIKGKVNLKEGDDTLQSP